MIGALIIVFSNDEALDAWARSFRHPMNALSVSWQVVSESYRALLTGAFGSPTFFVGDAMFFGKNTLGEVEELLTT